MYVTGCNELFSTRLVFSLGLWYKSQYLREAQVNILADEVCRHEDYYENMITDNMFCASRPDWSQDACEVFTTSQNSIAFARIVC